MRLVRIAGGLAMTLGSAAAAGAQSVPPRVDTIRVDSARIARPAPRDTTPTVGAAVPAPAGASRDTTTRRSRRTRATQPRPGIVPPISPRSAFLSSLLLPGLGQSRLQRPTTAAVFAGMEFAAIAMLIKSSGDLRDAKALRRDSVAVRFPLDSVGQPLPNPPSQVPEFNNDLVRARRLHLEDWIATIVFNHLLSGAEAFVSANLWDLPAQISARPSGRGAAVAMRITW